MLCPAEIYRWEKGLLRTRSSHPFIGSLPGPLLAGARAGSRLCGRANPKSPRRLAASKIPCPAGPQCFGWLARRRGDFRLGGVPKGKGMGSNSENLGPSRMVLGVQEGPFPLGGVRGKTRGKGRAWTPMVFGRLGSGGRPSLKAVSLEAFPLKGFDFTVGLLHLFCRFQCHYLAFRQNRSVFGGPLFQTF